MQEELALRSEGTRGRRNGPILKYISNYLTQISNVNFGSIYIYIYIRRSWLVIICFHWYRRNNKPLGRIRIGPNQLHDNQHWEKMTKQHGTLVTMVHNIGDV